LGGTVYSVGGRTFSFSTEIAEALTIGSYVRITSETGRVFLGQLLDVAVDRGSGSNAGVALSDRLAGRGRLLAELNEDGRPGTVDRQVAFGRGTMEPAAPELVKTRLVDTESSAAIELGELQQAPGVPAHLHADGFGRHTFLCGQSGSGKTYTLGVVLERLLLQTDIRIAVVDPNSDYVNLGTLRNAQQTGLDRDAQLALESRFQAIHPRIHVFGGDGSASRLRVRFGNLTIRQQSMLLGLDPLENADEYNAFVRTAQQLAGEEYGIHDLLAAVGSSFADDVRRLGLRIENLGVADMSIWAGAEDPPIARTLPDDWRMVVFDLGSLPSQREGSIVAATMLGHVWDRRASREPVIIVVDEAHNVCPQHPTGPNQALATEHLIRIAGEGRKYGLHLLLSTQRPDKIHQNVLSQCDNLILMRMNSAGDIASLSETFSFVPTGLLEQATEFGLGEGLAAGRIAPDPLLFQTGRRYTVEGGSDVPATWAERG
jgi:DNA helicase HerA-like ATPase